MNFPLDAPPPPCAGKHKLFDSREPADHIAAKELCDTCPLATYSACLKTLDAVSNTSNSLEGGAPEGTWAGKLIGKSPRWPGGLKPCGTTTAFKRHWRRGEESCEACKKAHREDQAARAAARRKGAA